MSRNTHTLNTLQQFVMDLKPGMKRQYDRNFNRDLSGHNAQDLLLRNVRLVLQQAYADTLSELQRLPLTDDGVQDEEGVADLCLRAQEPFSGFIEDIIAYALQKHRTSCALSNFPDEFNPDKDYINAVIDTVVRDRQEFAVQISSIITAQLKIDG